VIVIVVVVIMTMRMAVIRPFSRRMLVIVARPSRRTLRVFVAGTAVLIAVSVAAGPMPVLAHGVRIRRLERGGQRVKPKSNLLFGMNCSHSPIIRALMKLSVVIPVCNEAENVGPLAREIQAALAEHRPFEIIFVDDGSTDGTVAAIQAERASIPEIRLLQHSQRCGQSRAVCTGVEAARAEWVATLDGDGQNDPADIPNLIQAVAGAEPSLKLVMGNRTTRKDTWLRRFSSRVANRVRGGLLRDGTPDTGCGIKLMHRATFMRLPWFNHMHRFLPALYQRAGARVISVPVRHRPRTRGTSKYGLRNRLWVGIVDLFGVRWLILRNPPHIHIRETPLNE
jgi:dolichol-phosphate mannosyltransferase